MTYTIPPGTDAALKVKTCADIESGIWHEGPEHIEEIERLTLPDGSIRVTTIRKEPVGSLPAFLILIVG